MSQPTQTYKRSLAGSIGAGMGSIINGGGKTYFILEHKVSSKYHRAGEVQEIIVDQVELGRDSSCAVRFDESFSTVSRRHAAIVRDGQNWKLVQLSKTNTTFLNGKPVHNEWYLQNGDEIQLSVNGPKLGFIVPQGNKATVGSIGLSRRLSLFRQQALRPYKTAMWTMAAILLLVIAGGTALGIYQHGKISELVVKAELSEKERIEAEAKHQKELDDANARAAKLEEQVSKMEKRYKNLQNSLKDIKQSQSSAAPTVSGSLSSNKTLAGCEPHVYFVWITKIVLELDGDTRTLENLGSGSGFLLDDGRFITARHVVEPWMYPSGDEDTNSLLMNAVAHNGGTVTCYLDAYSPSGQHLSFKSTNAHINRSSDKKISKDGVAFKFPQNRALDWAYFQTSSSGGLKYNNTLSSTLPVQTKLTVLGYPLGIGAKSPEDVHPSYSEAVVAREGLLDGYILTTATTFEHGNSGGPVFATSSDGELIVVGLVSAGAGRSTGMVVPISSVK